jgi:hypothetical protein
MTTILLSYNEVQSLARKAAAGAGLPHGVAEDIGLAAAWLAARGADAVGIVVAALAGQGPHDILDGLAEIDALCGGGKDAVALGDHALLLIGLAGAVAKETGSRLAVDRGGGDIVPLASVRDVGSLASASALRRMSGDDQAAWPDAPRPAPSDAAAYAAALALAAKTYVPASDLSRAQGAGAGTTDND